ncbi:MAG: carbon-nitrogen hydrolase family protein [Acidimicrobiia bacterium]|nr:carbon-nitrogen hydrolase family protein [Acidimicrobiia bacterium]
MRATVIQGTPVFLDREATTEKACRLIEAAGASGAELIVFPEAFIPAYPDWVWRRTPWNDGESDWFGRLVENSVTVPSVTTAAIGAAARDAGAYVAMGVNELEPNGGTLYNTLLWFGPDGVLLGKHRKLMPTGGERLVWGTGDGSGLRVYETPFGRIGGLLCWENYMPLARTALYAQGIDIYVAPTWDNSDEWISTLRHIAKEGQCWVLGATPCIRGSDVPAEIPGRDEIYGGDDDWMSKGNSTIVAPGGAIVAGPLIGEEGTVTADLDMSLVRRGKRQFDVVGHYARPDIFNLAVRPAPSGPVRFLDAAGDEDQGS